MDDTPPTEQEKAPQQPGADAGRPAQVLFFGQYLLAAGLVSAEALEEALAYQEQVNIPLGALALSKGILSEKQLLLIHTEQRRTDQKFGEIAVKKGYLSRPQLDLLLAEQKANRVFLGEAIRQQGHLTREQLEEALVAYQEEQKEAEARVLRDLTALRDPLLVNTSVRLTTRMLLRMGGQAAKVAAVDEESRLAQCRYLFWQEVEGEFPFTYALGIDAEDLLLLSRAMLISVGEEELPEDVDLLVLDSGKEFVNVVVGHVCTRLSHEGYKTMPLPPDFAEEGTEFDLPAPWAGGTRKVHVGLVLPRCRMSVTLLTPAARTA